MTDFQYRAWLESIASNQNLKWTELRVFLILLGNLAYGTTVEISQIEIARQLNLTPGNVSRSIGKLCELEIIEKRYLAGKLVGYKLLVEEFEPQNRT